MNKNKFEIPILIQSDSTNIFRFINSFSLYLRVEMKPRDKEKIVFITYQFTVMSFGFCKPLGRHSYWQGLFNIPNSSILDGITNTINILILDTGYNFTG
jgi:hypothetical protein